jgi:hypothetical protein
VDPSFKDDPTLSHEVTDDEPETDEPETDEGDTTEGAARP